LTLCFFGFLPPRPLVFAGGPLPRRGTRPLHLGRYLFILISGQCGLFVKLKLLFTPRPLFAGSRRGWTSPFLSSFLSGKGTTFLTGCFPPAPIACRQTIPPPPLSHRAVRASFDGSLLLCSRDRVTLTVALPNSWAFPTSSSGPGRFDVSSAFYSIVCLLGLSSRLFDELLPGTASTFAAALSGFRGCGVAIFRFMYFPFLDPPPLHLLPSSPSGKTPWPLRVPFSFGGLPPPLFPEVFLAGSRHCPWSYVFLFPALLWAGFGALTHCGSPGLFFSEGPFHL